MKKPLRAFLALAVGMGFIIMPYINYKAKTTLVQKDPDLETVKSILLWNSFFKMTTWTLPIRYKDLSLNISCPHKCIVSRDKKFSLKYDAIVFHAQNHHDKPVLRRRSQIYIYFLMEPPKGRLPFFKQGTDFYNWTASYLNTSDVVCSYGRTDVLESENPLNYSYTQREQEPELNSTSQQRSDVAWIVSNCRSKERNMYVKELSKHINIDIYGRCGSFKCSDLRSSLCYKTVARKYMFILALENSYCPSYLTEKPFFTLKYGSVPIVYGNTNYQQKLPPNSFIDIMEFSTPALLAEHLKVLIKDRSRYMEHHEWRRKYEVHVLDMKTWICEVCTALHTHTSREQKVDVGKKFSIRQCSDPLLALLYKIPGVSRFG